MKSHHAYCSGKMLPFGTEIRMPALRITVAGVGSGRNPLTAPATVQPLSRTQRVVTSALQHVGTGSLQQPAAGCHANIVLISCFTCCHIRRYHPSSTKLVREHGTGRSQGYGFVTFTTLEQMQSAVTDLNGKPVEGKRLKVTPAKPREEVKLNTNVSACASFPAMRPGLHSFSAAADTHFLRNAHHFLRGCAGIYQRSTA